MTAPAERGHARCATPAEELAAQRRRHRSHERITRRLTRQRATLPWLVEGVPEDDPNAAPTLVDFDAWDTTAGEWGPDAPQRFATEAEAIDRLSAEVAHPGCDWARLQVRHTDNPVTALVVIPPLAAAATAALGGAP